MNQPNLTLRLTLTAGVAVPFLVFAVVPGPSLVLDPGPFLVFHNVTELFTVFVAFSIFGLGWFTFPQSQDRQALYFGAAFLAVGLIDLMHTLGYAGMPPLVTPNTGNKSTLLGLVARATTAAAFLGNALLNAKTAPWVRRPVLLGLALAFPAMVFALVTVSAPGWVVAYVEGTGLTTLKQVLEYAVIAGFVGAAAIYCRRLKANGDPLDVTYLAALVFCVVTEVEFTVYRNVYDSVNVLGHLSKAIAFGLIYRGVFVATVRRPYEKIRRSADEKETLLRELYHRTKNTLQMVQGLVVLQASEGTDVPEVKELVRKTEERIQAISLVHQRLFDSKDLSRISRRDFIQDLGDLILAGHQPTRSRVKFEVQVDDGAFLLDMAIPVGLVLNELLANSLSHGFPGDEGGTVSVRLAAGRPGWLLLQYDDDGIGMPPGFDLDRPESLGLTLVKTIGTQQLKGNVELTGHDGFHCTIEFPDDLYKARV